MAEDDDYPEISAEEASSMGARPVSQDSEPQSQGSEDYPEISAEEARAAGARPVEQEDYPEISAEEAKRLGAKPASEEEPEPEGRVRAALRTVANTALPAAASVIGGAGGAMVGGFPGAIGGALLGGGLAVEGQDWVKKNVLDWDDSTQEASNRKAYPFQTGAAEVATMLPGFGIGGVSPLVRTVLGVAGGTIDLVASGGDVPHAGGVALGSAALGAPRALGSTLIRAGESLAGKMGFEGEGLSASVARGMAEKENASNPQATPTQNAATTQAKDAAGASSVDPVGDEAAVRNASQGPSPGGNLGVAKEPTVSTANERVSPGEGPDSGPKRDNPGPQEYGKDKPPAGEGGLEAKPAGEVDEGVQAALKPKEPVTGPKEEPAQQQQQKPSTLIKNFADKTADEKRAILGRAAQQQSEGAGGGKPPGGPPPGGGKGAAPPEPPPRYTGPKDTAEHAGETFNRTLDNLGRMQNADFYDFMGKLKTATQSAATLLGKGGQDISRAIESGKYNELPEQLRKHWENFSGDIKKEITALEAEAAKRNIKPPETDDPNYIHRIRKMPFSWKDWINNDPVSALKGMIRPDMMKPLEYRGAEAADGTRLVLQDRSPTAYSIWRNGERSDYAPPQREEGAKGFKNGDKIEYNGKQYTVDRGRAEEITKHARDENGKPIQYKENAAASLYEHRAQLKAAIAYDDMLRTFKGDKALDPYRMRASSQEGQNATKNKGFVKLHGEPFKDFEGIAMHPDLAQAIRNNYEPGLGIHNNPIVNAMRSLNQFAVKSIFWNPVPHSMNALMHYVVARGEDWLPFKFDKDSYLPKGVSLDNYKRLGESWKQAANVFRAYYDVGTQSGIMKDLNHSGVPLVQSSRERANAHEAIGTLLGANLKAEPRLWAGWAQKFGLGQAADAVKAVYDASGKALWAASDAMMAARVYELEAKNLTREQAIAHASVHMPDYVIPNKLFGARGLPSTMADPSIFMFGRYHVKVLDSLAHMSMDAIGPNSTVEQRRQAFGNIMAVGMLATVVYPALDAAVKAVTGNEDAQARRRGPMAPLNNIKEAVAPEEGKPPRTYASTISNLATISPMARAMKEALLDNRDWRGKSVIEPASPFYKQAGQLGEYLTKTAVSPYATAEVATSEKGPGVASSLLQQVTDTKVPTDEQVGGQAKAAKSLQKQAIGRDKRPQGFIEQLLSGL